MVKPVNRYIIFPIQPQEKRQCSDQKFSPSDQGNSPVLLSNSNIRLILFRAYTGDIIYLLR
jgi:hypothetical protein